VRGSEARRSKQGGREQKHVSFHLSLIQTLPYTHKHSTPLQQSMHLLFHCFWVPPGPLASRPPASASLLPPLLPTAKRTNATQKAGQFRHFFSGPVAHRPLFSAPLSFIPTHPPSLHPPPPRLLPQGTHAPTSPAARLHHAHGNRPPYSALSVLPPHVVLCQPSTLPPFLPSGRPFPHPRLHHGHPHPQPHRAPTRSPPSVRQEQPSSSPLYLYCRPMV
jgi:hypothetical protein